jgi:hypothetical protein
VRTAWLAALAALLYAAPAAAQSADAGAGEVAPAAGEGSPHGAGGADDLPPMMRDPRQLSGIPRGEEKDRAGRLTVRAVQGPMERTEFGDVKSRFPAGGRIHLLGIGVGGKISHRSLPLDGGGRVVFDGLATDNSENYVVMAIFPRDGAEDRLMSKMVSMPPQVGMRMILAGEGPQSGKPAVDDLVNEDNPQIEMPEAGVAIVYLRGQTRDVQEIELVEAGKAEPIARSKVEVMSQSGPPDGRVAPAVDDKALRAGLLEVLVNRRGKGVAGVAVTIAASGAAADAPPLRKADTGDDGRALFEPLPPGQKYIVRAAVKGRTFESAAIDPPGKVGQRIAVEVDWQEGKVLQSRFTGLTPDKVYVARAAGQSRPYLSMPFQVTSTRGAATNVIIAAPIWFAFHGGANLEDEKLFFQLQLSVYNASLVPYDPGAGGLRIPLPKGFTSASVDEEMSARVKVDEDRGLVWRGLLPPGERRFIAGFAIPTVDGKATFDMPLPYGLFDGQLVFEKMAGMRVTPPAGVRERSGKADDGRAVVMFQNMQLAPNESLRLSLAGLPQHPAWRRWVNRAIGVLVLALLGWGIWGVATRSRRGGGRKSHLEAEREELLQAVVQLEADLRRERVREADYQRRRGELLRQLEDVYAQLAAEEKAENAAGTRAGP